MLALPAPRQRAVRPALETPPIIYLSGPVAIPPPLIVADPDYTMSPELRAALVKYVAGLDLRKSAIVNELDDAMIMLLRLRNLARDIHGTNNFMPWQLTERGKEMMIRKSVT